MINYNNYGTFYENESLKNYNTYQVDSIAKKLLIVTDEAKLVELLNELSTNNESYIMLGNGSNVIFAKPIYEELIIINKLNDVEISDTSVYVGAGKILISLVNELLTKNLGGLEWASGIPGSIGGSIYNNAGAYNAEIANYIDTVKVYNKTNQKVELLSVNDCAFGYRESIFKINKNYIILGATLNVKKVDLNESRELIKDRLERRLKSQPLEYPSAGSVFRNPTDIAAWQVIESNNLKGYHVNGAYISEKHANFIINKDNATGADIKELINIIKTKAYENNQIELKLEQEIIE